MTWIERPALVIAAHLSALDGEASLLVLGVDRLPPSDLELVRSWTVPVIAIGADPGIPRAHVLGPKLTSRELKRALRAALTHETPKSAVV